MYKIVQNHIDQRTRSKKRFLNIQTHIYRDILIKKISKLLRESKKVIIIGNYGSGNIGDESMLISLSNILIDIGIEDIFVPTNNYKLLSILCEKSVKPINIIESPLKILKSDTIIVGGGTLFSKFSRSLMRISLLLCIFFKILKKKLFFIGFGVSNDTPRLLKPILKISLSMADSVTVRDNISNKILKSWGIKSIVIPDLAYGIKIKENEMKTFFNLNYHNKYPKLGVALSSTVDNIVYEKIPAVFGRIFNDIMEELNYEVDIYFFTFSPGFTRMKSDKILNLQVIQNMNNNQCVKILPYHTPQITIKIIKRLNMLIGMRFHSKVFAHMTETPLIGIIAHDKDRAFHIEVKYPNFELNDILDNEEVRKRFLKCIKKELQRL